MAQLRAAGCVFAEEEAALLVGAADRPDTLALLASRRVAGEPLELVLGWVEFAGLRLEVGAGVFVPRRRTELLVEEVLALVEAGPGGDRGGDGRDSSAPVRVLDLCCGTGAVGCAVLSRCREAELVASDVEPPAVHLAARNLARHVRGEEVRWRVALGDLFAPVPTDWRAVVDVCVANAPYVPSAELTFLPRESRLHEPRRAVDGGADGLTLHRRLAHEAHAWVRPGGHVLVEVGERQAEAATSLFAAAGWTPRVVHRAEDGATVVIATRASSRETHRLGA